MTEKTPEQHAIDTWRQQTDLNWKALRKFEHNLTLNPLYAFEHGVAAMRSAARIAVFAALINDVKGGADLKRLHHVLQQRIQQRARSVTRTSSSETANMMGRHELEAMADIANDMRMWLIKE